MKRYPPEVHEYVKEWTRKLRDDDLAEECNRRFGTAFTAHSMKSFRGNHKYCNGKKQWTTEEYWKYQKKYPKGMYEFIRDNSWNVSSARMAEMVEEKFGYHFTATGMKQFRQRNGIKSGLTGWFQKSVPPGTKGRKQEDFIKDPEAMQRTVATRFRKGHRPVNEMPVGTVRMGAAGYLIRKKQMQGTQWERWEMLHKAVWEEANGPVPKGMVLIFRDGDRTNVSLDNLVLVTRGELAQLNRKYGGTGCPEILDAKISLIRLKNGARDRKHGRL